MLVIVGEHRKLDTEDNTIIDQFHERHKDFKLNVTSHPGSRSGSGNVLRSTEKIVLRAV